MRGRCDGAMRTKSWAIVDRSLPGSLAGGGAVVRRDAMSQKLDAFLVKFGCLVTRKALPVGEITSVKNSVERSVKNKH